MTVAPVSSATTSGASAAGASSSTAATNALSYDDFLSLLMTELQNQDPTQPMDPSAMVTQLATVSQVGQTVKMNSTLSSMLTMNSLSQAELLVGQTISSADGTTGGTVDAVSVSGSGSTALLTNGQTLPLDDALVVQ